MKYYKLKDIQKRDFYKIYKELFSNEEYIKISAEAKWTYVILVDKLDNPKADNEGNLYLTSIREEMQNLLNVSVNTVTKVFKELVSVGLISESKQGFGEVKKTYVKRLENIDTEQIHNNSENIINTENTETLEIRNDNEREIINSRINNLNNDEPLHDSQILNLDNSKNEEVAEKIIEEVIVEKTAKITPIEKFILEDIEDAKREASKVAFSKSTFSKYENILDNIEIKSFLGNDKAMIEKAIDLIVKGSYQDKKVKNIKKLTKNMIELAVLKCKNRIRFKHTRVIKVLVDEILKTLEEKI